MPRTRARQCTGKIRHDTKEQAEQHFYALKRRGATGIHVYKCRKFCGGYHVGHKPKPRRNR